MSVIRQLSLFGADAAPPEPADLRGLLAGPGEIVGRGDAAQISVVVDHPWRAAELVAECARRGISATTVSTMDGHTAVRTAYSVQLSSLVPAWSGGEARRLTLDGRALRLWAIAAGHPTGGPSYTLASGASDAIRAEAIAAALAALGLPAQVTRPRSRSGVSYRIVGLRRVSRLAELVGDPPKRAPAAIWPS